MERIKRARLKEFVILKADEWEGGIVIRTGGGTTVCTQNCLSWRLPRTVAGSHARTRRHQVAVGSHHALSHSEVRKGLWASQRDSTQLAQRAADLHTVTTPSRTTRLPCSGWCGRVGVWACGTGLVGTGLAGSRCGGISVRAMAHTLVGSTAKHDESSPGMLRGLKPKQRSSRGLRKPMCTRPAG
jgi:hypothetical protein